VEKNNTVANLAAPNSTGNKVGGYVIQSAATRSLSLNNGIGQSTADTIKTSDAQFMANIQKRSL